jgi:hypothetical protein
LVKFDRLVKIYLAYAPTELRSLLPEMQIGLKEKWQLSGYHIRTGG